MANGRGIPETNTDATQRAGILAPAINAAGNAIGDIDLTVADHENRIEDLENLTESTANKVETLEQRDFATKSELDSTRGALEGKDNSHDSALEALQRRMQSMEAAQISTGVDVAPGSSPVPPYVPPAENPYEYPTLTPDPNGGLPIWTEGASPVAVQTIDTIAGTGTATTDKVKKLIFQGEGATYDRPGAGIVRVRIDKPQTLDVQGIHYNADGTLAGAVYVTDPSKLIFQGAGVSTEDVGGGIVRATIAGGITGQQATETTLSVLRPMPPVGRYYLPGRYTGTSSSGGSTLFMGLVITSTTTWDRIGFYVGGNGSGQTNPIARLGIYTANANGMPATKVLDSGTFPTGAGFFQAVVSVTLTPGIYWAAFTGANGLAPVAVAPDTLAGAFLNIAGPPGGNTVSWAMNGYSMTQSNYSTAPLPDTVNPASVLTTSSNPPAIFLRRAA